ncbi:metallophosphoesterase family protein [Peribacillus alkalitolerans]|uniref:metallophosphoesterase family protein n=1 Tax=Peribacillus alkalitolerans TaxID=1550385 RepID=UPI0013D1F232|nr:metallophosphoesterase [Peribacillus alkalitolerans]
MKILIVSDSHGQTEILEILKNRHQHEVQAMIHCGDSELNHEDPALEGFQTVKGNCDFLGAFSEELTFSQGGYNFYVAHGHKHNVKMTLMNLLYRAEEVSANIICFGHSHHAGSEMIDEKLFINPGSIYLPRGRREKTYVILELEETAAHVHFYDEEGNLQKQLTTTYHFS